MDIYSACMTCVCLSKVEVASSKKDSGERTIIIATVSLVTICLIIGKSANEYCLQAWERGRDVQLVTPLAACMFHDTTSFLLLTALSLGVHPAKLDEVQFPEWRKRCLANFLRRSSRLISTGRYTVYSPTLRWPISRHRKWAWNMLTWS